MEGRQERGSCKESERRGNGGRGTQHRKTAGVEYRENSREERKQRPPLHSSPSSQSFADTNAVTELCDLRKTQHAGNQKGGSGRITQDFRHTLWVS